MATTTRIGTSFGEGAIISANGRYVVFEDFPNIFLQDLATGEITNISVSSDEVEGDLSSASTDSPAISADGRFVAFSSDATNLVPNDTNGELDLFLRDVVEGTTTRISLDSDGNAIPANVFDVSLRPSISADGRFVAFQTEALFAGSTTGQENIFVRDVKSNTTELISVDSEGVQGDGVSYGPSISADGRFVAFHSLADNLVEDDTFINFDVFVRDRQNQTTIRASVNSQGEKATGSEADSSNAIMSPNGRYVVFESNAINLVPNDTNEADDIFQHDLETGETTRISVDSNGNQANGGSALGFGKSAISSDGRYIVFQSVANNLVEGDTNNALDVFVRDTVEETTTRVSLNSNGEEPVGGFLGTESFGGTISGDGQQVVFMSNGRNMNDEGIDTSKIYLRNLSTNTNEAPTVTNPIADVTVEENAENQTIDLSNVFSDADEDEITVTVQSNSNSELVTATIEDHNLILDFQEERTGTAEIILRATANGQTVDDTFSITVDADEPSESDDTIELFRFRNTTFETGTYIFVGEEERNAIEADPNLNQIFQLEGEQEGSSTEPAFIASATPGEDLEPLYRFQSNLTPGTFVFAGEPERQSINENFAEEFTEEGLAFYVYGADTGRGAEFTRFQNNQNNTFLFAGASETETIENDPNFSAIFTNQGVAFESLV